VTIEEIGTGTKLKLALVVGLVHMMPTQILVSKTCKTASIDAISGHLLTVTTLKSVFFVYGYLTVDYHHHDTPSLSCPYTS
jgi:uncharacterized protein with PQ loop repeat